MKCPKCQFENPEGSKFCLECGRKIELICPHCDKALLIAAKFCNECGHDLREPRKTPSIDLDKPRSYTPNFLADGKTYCYDHGVSQFLTLRLLIARFGD